MSSLLLVGGAKLGARATAVLHGFSLGPMARSTGLYCLCDKHSLWNAPCVLFTPLRTMLLCSTSPTTTPLQGSQNSRNTLQPTFPLPYSQNLYKVPLPMIIASRTLVKKSAPRPHLQPRNVRDGLSHDFSLIFANNAINYVQYGVPLYLCMVTFCTVIVLKIVYDNMIHGKTPKELDLGIGIEIGDPMKMATVCLAAVPFAYVSVLSVCRTVVHRIYYNPATKQYAAAILKYGIIKDNLKFVLEDVKVLPKTASIRGCTVIKGRRCLLTEKDFTHTVHYNKFMGYDLARDSEYQQIKEGEDVFGLIVKGMEGEQKRKESKFEQKFRERRKRKARSDH